MPILMQMGNFESKGARENLGILKLEGATVFQLRYDYKKWE